MGAWGRGNFKNDSALDWVNKLIYSKGYSVIIEAFDTIQANKGSYLEVDECNDALAAAEIVAALAGNPSSSLPKNVSEWVSHHLAVDEEILQKAKQAVMVVLSDSELRDLWEEVDALEEWNATQIDLIKRLEVGLTHFNE